METVPGVHVDLRSAKPTQTLSQTERTPAWQQRVSPAKSASAFGRVVRVERRPHECQDPGFPSVTLHCGVMIIVIHFSCQWFSRYETNNTARRGKCQFEDERTVCSFTFPTRGICYALTHLRKSDSGSVRCSLSSEFSLEQLGVDV